jgi:hypothetical protein
MIGRLQAMRPVTVAIGGCSPPCSPVWNFGPGFSFSGDALQADGFLPAHRLGDGAVLGRLQRQGIDLAAPETCACVRQFGWAQQAADLVGAEGDAHAVVLMGWRRKSWLRCRQCIEKFYVSTYSKAEYEQKRYL